MHIPKVYSLQEDDGTSNVQSFEEAMLRLSRRFYADDMDLAQDSAIYVYYYSSAVIDDSALLAEATIPVKIWTNTAGDLQKPISGLIHATKDNIVCSKYENDSDPSEFWAQNTNWLIDQTWSIKQTPNAATGVLHSADLLLAAGVALSGTTLDNLTMVSGSTRIRIPTVVGTKSIRVVYSTGAVLNFTGLSTNGLVSSDKPYLDQGFATWANTGYIIPVGSDAPSLHIGTHDFNATSTSGSRPGLIDQGEVFDKLVAEIGLTIMNLVHIIALLQTTALIRLTSCYRPAVAGVSIPSYGIDGLVEALNTSVASSNPSSISTKGQLSDVRSELLSEIESVGRGGVADSLYIRG